MSRGAHTDTSHCKHSRLGNNQSNQPQPPANMQSTTKARRIKYMIFLCYQCERWKSWDSAERENGKTKKQWRELNTYKKSSPATNHEVAQSRVQRNMCTKNNDRWITPPVTAGKEEFCCMRKSCKSSVLISSQWSSTIRVQSPLTPQQQSSSSSSNRFIGHDVSTR